MPSPFTKGAFLTVAFLCFTACAVAVAAPLRMTNAGTIIQACSAAPTTLTSDCADIPCVGMLTEEAVFRKGFAGLSRSAIRWNTSRLPTKCGIVDLAAEFVSAQPKSTLGVALEYTEHFLAKSVAHSANDTNLSAAPSARTRTENPSWCVPVIVVLCIIVAALAAVAVLLFCWLRKAVREELGKRMLPNVAEGADAFEMDMRAQSTQGDAPNAAPQATSGLQLPSQWISTLPYGGTDEGAACKTTRAPYCTYASPFAVASADEEQPATARGHAVREPDMHTDERRASQHEACKGASSHCRNRDGGKNDSDEGRAFSNAPYGGESS